MSNKSKQWGAIIVMFALFAMIAFVTNLCSPMAVIVKNQFGATNLQSQIGNYGNFIAYLIMGIPTGMLLKKIGYKRTALLALIVGLVAVFIQYMSGWESMKDCAFWVYLTGAFIGGLCMCMLNTVVNPMLNILGGGGDKGNQLLQIGGVFNSAAAVAVYIIMGALIGEATKATVSDATPALFIAMAIFAIAFVVILFTKIDEPERADLKKIEQKEHAKAAPAGQKDKYSAFSFRHFRLGILAIFLYMGVEVGTPTYILQYLTADTPDTIAKKEQVMKDCEAKQITIDAAAIKIFALSDSQNQKDMEGILADPEPTIGRLTFTNDKNEFDAEKQASAEKKIKELSEQISAGEITAAKLQKTVPGMGMAATIVGLIVAVYWLMMLVGRFVGGMIGGKVSSRKMITVVSIASMVLIAFGMFMSDEVTLSIPGIDWANLTIIWAEVPVGIFAFILVGLCTSVMWGGIFNMAVEGLGKYTAIASGAFMTMVFGCAVMVAIQAWVADLTASYMISYFVPLACAAYILYYALIGSKNVNTDIPVAGE